MSELGFTPKHLLVAEQIRQEILSGRLKVGERLKPDTELARQYGINKRTVACGMAELVREGLITRAPKRGSLVAANSQRGDMERKSKGVGVIAVNQGHLYEEMGNIINRGLVQHGLYPVWINQDLFRDAQEVPGISEMEQMMRHLLEDSPFGMLIDADRFIPIEILKHHLERAGKLVFLYRYLHAERLPGQYVLLDFPLVGEIMARHLMERGHRRIGYLSFPQPLRAGYPDSPQEIVCRSMRECCRGGGVEFIDEMAEMSFSGIAPERIVAELRAAGRFPDAVGVHSDSYWVEEMMPVMRKFGLHMPRDLSVIGFGNTPWVRQTEVPLTSVDIRGAEMAKLAVDMLTGENTDESVIVQPRLVLRDSVADKKIR